jgi:hypothetical protein
MNEGDQGATPGKCNIKSLGTKSSIGIMTSLRIVSVTASIVRVLKLFHDLYEVTNDTHRSHISASTSTSDGKRQAAVAFGVEADDVVASL